VLVDAGFKEQDVEGSFWLHLYVMLSRATSASDLLVLRGPPVDFLKSGPPPDLAAKLRRFDQRVKRCRESALALAHTLGLAPFLH